MNHVTLEISPATEDDVVELLSTIRALDSEPKIETISSKGFGGTTDVILLISFLGSPYVVKNLATVIIAWIKRNEKKVVTIGKTKISGYSADEVADLLKKMKPK